MNDVSPDGGGGVSTAGGGAALPPQLVYRGGRTIRDLTFKTFYYGAVWQGVPPPPIVNPHAAARALIDETLAIGMSDPGLNGLLSQYFNGDAISATALPSAVITDAPRTVTPNVPFNENDLRTVLTSLVPNGMAGLDLTSTVVNIVLPMGMSLEILGVDQAARPPGTKVMPGVPCDAPNHSSGIAGYHGSMAITGLNTDLLYSVVVWSDGSTGIPVPGWQGWENIVATLYHELQETRTDPDVDCATRTGDNHYIGWNTDPIQGPDGLDCREIADLPLILHSDNPFAAFARVPVSVPGGTTVQVPVQLMWSNKDGRMMPAVLPSTPPGAPASLASLAAASG
jgi:hypothetical protein